MNKVFGSFEYMDEAELFEFIKSLDQPKAVSMLIAAVAFANAKGVYSLEESKILGACVKTLTEQPQIKKE